MKVAAFTPFAAASAKMVAHAAGAVSGVDLVAPASAFIACPDGAVIACHESDLSFIS